MGGGKTENGGQNNMRCVYVLGSYKIHQVAKIVLQNIMHLEQSQMISNLVISYLIET